MASCVICHRDEPGRRPQDPGRDLICSRCVQKLVNATSLQITAMYQNARDLGMDENAELLKPFVKE